MNPLTNAFTRAMSQKNCPLYRARTAAAAASIDSHQCVVPFPARCHFNQLSKRNSFLPARTTHPFIQNKHPAHTLAGPPMGPGSLSCCCCLASHRHRRRSRCLMHKNIKFPLMFAYVQKKKSQRRAWIHVLSIQHTTTTTTKHIVDETKYRSLNKLNNIMVTRSALLCPVLCDVVVCSGVAFIVGPQLDCCFCVAQKFQFYIK